MLLRVILVSIVAGLGVTPPAESDLAGWSRSAQAWLDGRIAEWIALEGPQKEVVVGAVGENAAPSLEALIAELRDDCPDEVVLAEPEAVTEPIATPTPVPTPTTATELAKDAVAADRAFEAIVEEMVAEFSLDRGALIVVAPTAVEPVLDQDAIDQLDESFDDAEAVALGRVAIEAAGVTTAVDSAVSDEALEFVDDLYPGLAYAAEFETEQPLQAAELDLTSAPVPQSDESAGEQRVIPHSAGNPLGRAVGLTREAVYAWLNLLQSSAIVTLPE